MKTIPDKSRHNLTMNQHGWPETGNWPQRDPEAITTFGERLAIARKARGLSQNKLAKRAGCSQPLISQIEAGGPDAPADLKSELMMKISDALGVSARWLLWGTGPVSKWTPLNEEDRALILSYRALPAPFQEHVRRVISSLLTASSAPSAVNPFPPAPHHKNHK